MGPALLVEELSHSDHVSICDQRCSYIYQYYSRINNRCAVKRCDTRVDAWPGLLRVLYVVVH